MAITNFFVHGCHTGINIAGCAHRAFRGRWARLCCREHRDVVFRAPIKPAFARRTSIFLSRKTPARIAPCRALPPPPVQPASVPRAPLSLCAVRRIRDLSSANRTLKLHLVPRKIDAAGFSPGTVQRSAPPAAPGRHGGRHRRPVKPSPDPIGAAWRCVI